MSAPLHLVVPAAANASGPAVSTASGAGSGSVARVDAGDAPIAQPPFAQVLQKLVKALEPHGRGAPPTVLGIGAPDLVALQIATNAAAVAGNMATADPTKSAVAAPSGESDLAALLAQLGSPLQQQAIAASHGAQNISATNRKVGNGKARDEADVASTASAANTDTAGQSLTAAALAAQSIASPAPAAPPGAQPLAVAAPDASLAAPQSRAIAVPATAPAQTQPGQVPVTQAASEHPQQSFDFNAPVPATIAAAVSTHVGNSTEVVVNNDSGSEFAAALVRARGDDGAVLAATQASASAEAAKNSAAVVQNSTPALVVNTPVGNAGWTGEIADKLTWMVGRQEQRVELVLNPPQLGRVEVSLTLNGDQASAQFLSANPVVREALDSAMPRLRDMLAEGGITLGQTHVGSDSPGQAANQRENSDNRQGAGSGSAMVDMPVRAGSTATQWLSRGRGLVDVFA